MTNYISSVPVWVSILFLISVLVPVFMLAGIAKKEKRELTYKKVLIFFTLYFAYVSMMCFSGMLSTNTLPPQILLLTTIPLFVFLIVYILNTSFFKLILRNTHLEDLVHFHIFRFIGVFFFIAYYYNVLPKDFAFLAGFGDIITAVASIFVVKAIKSGWKFAIPMAWIWNIFGIIDTLSVITTALILTKVSIENGTIGVIEMAKFPFCLIPAFAPPIIIFMHIAIFKKLWAKKREI